MRSTRSRQDQACTFCNIAAGASPADLVYRDVDFAAFLDHNPLVWGHCLVVPVRHRSTLLDLPDDLVGPLFVLVRRLALVMERRLGAEGSFVAVNTKVSQSVKHLHVHVVPRHEGDGLFRGAFHWIRHPYENPDCKAEIAAKITEEMQAIS